MDQEQAKQLDELRELLKRMKTGYRKIKSDAEAQVSREEYASGPYVSLIPFDQERSQQVKGKPIAKPKTVKNCHVYGIDVHNRIVVVRGLGPVGKATTEEFLTCEPSHCLSRSYLNISGERRVGKVLRLNYDRNGILASSIFVGGKGNFRAEKYFYENGRLKSIEVEGDTSGVKGTFQDKFDFIYDDSGGGEAIFIRSDGERRPAFKFLKPHSAAWKNEWPA
ncbi:MAG: hypothetical protein JO170_07880 [Verrucomicrobia bacterium]|nr:hypothetical protein [Verrucomicrobiota bacterium]